MRWLPLLLIASLLMMGTAHAAEGMRSKLTMTMKMDTPEPQPEMQGFGDSMSFNGEMYVAGDKIRMDLIFMGMTSTTIIDSAASEMWMLEPFTQRAIHTDLSKYQQNFLEDEGGFMSPTGMSMDMEQYKQAIEGMKGFTYKDIPGKMLLGEKCQGLEFAIDMDELAKAVAAGELSEQEAQALSGSMVGTVYFSEKYDLPMLMNMQMSQDSQSMDLIWEVTEISDWAPEASMFEIPEGYKVVEADEMMEQMQGAGNPHGA